jgi:hypothetical protein
MYERETQDEFSSIKSSCEIRPRNEAKNIWLFLLPVSSSEEIKWTFTK